MMKYVGLIGYPLGHSVSPAMQQAAFDHYKLDLRYELWETEEGKLGDVLERLRLDETVGANVTAPHKEAVPHSMDELDNLAREIGAVNTIVNRGGRLIGYNTDAGGFLDALRKEGGFDPAGKDVVLIGAGGVARAASFALARAGVKSLALTDISMEQAQRLAVDLKRSLARAQGPPPRSSVDAKDGGVDELDSRVWPIPEISVLSPNDPQFGEVLRGCDLLVNCSPIGMKHSPTEGESPVEAKLIPKGALVYDVVYNPSETPLLADAKKVGARTLGGLAMLVYQGAMSFELWTGKKAPIDIMFQAAKKALSEDSSGQEKKSTLQNYNAGVAIFLIGFVIFLGAAIMFILAGLDIEIGGLERITDWITDQLAGLSSWSWPANAPWVLVIGVLGIFLMVLGFLGLRQSEDDKG
jgi:shikimate dehydrogenase